MCWKSDENQMQVKKETDDRTLVTELFYETFSILVGS